MSADDRQIICITEMLTAPSRGIYTQWTWYSDGSVEEALIPKGLVIFPEPLWAY